MQEPRAVYEALVGPSLTTHQQHLVRERPVGPIKVRMPCQHLPRQCARVPCTSGRLAADQFCLYFPK